MASGGPGQQDLLNALHALYHNEDPAVKEQANKWLEQWQATQQAWSISDGVLHDPNSTMEAQYFCAQTLRTKVQRDFEELPQDAVISLRESLMALLIKYANGAPPVRTQLCLALVALSVHLPAEHWAVPGAPNNMGGAVAWFAARLQTQPQDTALPCLLELLTVMPQEVNSFKYAVRPERRRQHALELRGATGAAIEMLTSCLRLEAAARLRPSILEAFGGWLKLSEGAALGPDGTQLPSHPLVVAALEGLRSGGALFSASVDAVCELVWVSVDPESGMVVPLMMPLVQALVPAVMSLRPRFGVAVARAAAEHYEENHPQHMGRSASAAGPVTDDFDDDDATTKKMAVLLAEVAEAYIHLIATAAQEVQAPVEAMLEVASHPDHAVASMSFTFWHRLARTLNSGWGPRMAGSGSMMDLTAAPTADGDAAMAEQARRRAFFAPAFERLVSIVRHRVRFPPQSSKWSKEQMADFRKTRYEIADTLEDCASVLRYPRTLDLVVEPLMELSAAISAGRAAFDWRTAEAALFCVRSIGPYAEEEPAGHPERLAQLLGALYTMHQDVPLLQTCICYLIARYAGWLSRALRAESAAPQGSPPVVPNGAAALLQGLLGLVVYDLEVPEASSAASSALLDLCGCCGSYMLPSVNQLLQLYSRLLGAGVVSRSQAAATASASGQGAGTAPRPAGLAGMQEEDVHLAMQAICVMVGKCMAPDQINTTSLSLLEPALSAAQAAALALPPPPPGGPQAPAVGAPSLFVQHPALCSLLDRLGVLLTHTASPAAVSEMLGRCLPVLELVFSRAPRDERILERACRVVRLGIKGAGREGAARLPAVLQATTSHFAATSHPAFLYILSELIKVFSRDDAYLPPLAQALLQMLQHATAQLTTYEQMCSNPELVDDTYILANRALSYRPQLLVHTLLAPDAAASIAAAGGAGPAAGALPVLLDCAAAGLLLQHREANLSVLSFLARLLSPALRQDAPGLDAPLQALLGPRAALMMRLLLAAVVGVAPNARLGDVANVMALLLIAGGQQGLSWLAAAVNSLAESVVGTQDKEAFLGNAAAALAAAAASQGQLSKAQERAWEGAIDDLADLCRRNSRVRIAGQQALIPAGLAAAVVAV